MLHDLDRKLLRQLQADPEANAVQLAGRTGLSPATVWRRLKKLQSTGVLERKEAVIDWSALGYSIQISLHFTLDKTRRHAFDEFLTTARKVPEVIEIQTFLGRIDVRLSVLARDMKHYQEIYHRRILTLPHIADVEALTLISTVKSEMALPL